MKARVGLGTALACALAALVPLTVGKASTSGAGDTPPISTTPYSGFDPSLSRAPYVTDLTQTSAQITWGTTTGVHGGVKYGVAPNCSAVSMSVDDPSQANGIGGVTRYQVSPSPRSGTSDSYPLRYVFQTSVRLTGLSSSTQYCYDVYGTDPSGDLLPPAQPTQSFTTLDPVSPTSQTPLTFDVVADLGETSNRGPANDATANNPSSVNSNQSAVMSLIGSSGARFVVAVGDIAYNDGSEANYGDLEQTGTSVGTPALTEISDIFGPSYWPLTGGIPMFAAIGNHGYNTATGINTWPEKLNSSDDPGEFYGMYPYSSIDGIQTKSYPSAWYAFSSGNARFYILDGSWNDGATGGNFGNATGSDCPLYPNTTNCKGYQVDGDVHFAPGTAEYTWLSNDLQAHPGGLKFAFWHYPLRSDNATIDSDVYAQRAVEPLLAQYGVSIVFNGHSHTYERNTAAGPNTVVSYVTGGGGGVVNPVAGAKAPNTCGSWDAYAIGWAYNAGPVQPDGSHPGAGSKCGSAVPPTSDAQVAHFLKVTVTGTIVQVTPMNATGHTFDPMTYTVPQPVAPGNVVATALSSTSAQVSWSPPASNSCGTAAYLVTRAGGSTATVTAPTTSYVDRTLPPNTPATYTVVTQDGCGQQSPAAASNQITTPVFTTGFESGSFNGWTKTSNVSVQSQTAHPNSTYSAVLSASAGQSAGSYAIQNLPVSTTNSLYAQGWAYLPNSSTTATLLALRTSTTQVAQVYLSNGVLKVLDNISHASYLSTTAPTTGTWHQVTLQVNETGGTMEVWLDGIPVQFTVGSSRTYQISGQSFTPSGASGPAPMSALQLGDDSTSRTYQWYADDLWVSTVPPAAPSAPGNVIAAATSPTSVQLSWSASAATQPGAVVRYQIARNQTQVGSVAAPATAFTDGSVPPGTTATYTVTAVDQYGSTSLPGTSNQITTPLTNFDTNSTGPLTGWTSSTGVTVQNQVAHSAPNAASLSAGTGTQSFAIQTLSISSNVAYAQEWVQVSSLSSNTMTLMALRASTGQIARVFLQSSGAISVANNVDPTHPSYVGNITLSPGGTWYEVTFGIDENAGTMQVWVGNSSVRFNTGDGTIGNQKFTPTNAQGPSPISTFQLGDDSNQHTYAFYADDITVSPAQPAF